jgi:hypothetical protein
MNREESFKQYPIEKGIPLPPQRSNRNGRQGGWKYNWGAMEVGDSFFVPGRTAYSMRAVATQTPAKKYPKWRFSIREVDGGARIWRIK